MRVGFFFLLLILNFFMNLYDMLFLIDLSYLYVIMYNLWMLNRKMLNVWMILFIE